MSIYMFVDFRLLCDQRDTVHLFRTMHEFAHLISRLCCVFSQVSPLPQVESTSLVQPRCNVASIFLLGTVHHCFTNECGVLPVVVTQTVHVHTSQMNFQQLLSYLRLTAFQGSYTQLTTPLQDGAGSWD